MSEVVDLHIEYSSDGRERIKRIPMMSGRDSRGAGWRRPAMVVTERLQPDGSWIFAYSEHVTRETPERRRPRFCHSAPQPYTPPPVEFHETVEGKALLRRCLDFAMPRFMLLSSAIINGKTVITLEELWFAYTLTIYAPLWMVEVITDAEKNALSDAHDEAKKHLEDCGASTATFVKSPEMIGQKWSGRTGHGICDDFTDLELRYMRAKGAYWSLVRRAVARDKSRRKAWAKMLSDELGDDFCSEIEDGIIRPYGSSDYVNLNDKDSELNSQEVWSQDYWGAKCNNDTSAMAQLEDEAAAREGISKKELSNAGMGTASRTEDSPDVPTTSHCQSNPEDLNPSEVWEEGNLPSEFHSKHIEGWFSNVRNRVDYVGLVKRHGSSDASMERIHKILFPRGGVRVNTKQAYNTYIDYYTRLAVGDCEGLPEGILGDMARDAYAANKAFLSLGAFSEIWLDHERAPEEIVDSSD